MNEPQKIGLTGGPRFVAAEGCSVGADATERVPPVAEML